MLCYVISYHIIYHIISYHIILYYIISCYIVLYYIISYHIISYYIISYSIILYCIILYYIISYSIILYCIISYHIISYHIILYYIISYYIIYTWILAMKSRLALMQYSKGVKSLHKLLMSADSQVSAHSNVLCQEPLKIGPKKSEWYKNEPWKIALSHPAHPILVAKLETLWPMAGPLRQLGYGRSNGRSNGSNGCWSDSSKIWPIILLLILPVFRCVQQSHQTHQTPRRND